MNIKSIILVASTVVIIALVIKTYGGSDANPVVEESIVKEIPTISEVSKDIEVIKLEDTLPDNYIVDTNHELSPIYEKLYRLKSGDKNKSTLTIVHIGDSHLQAGFLNGTVRKLLQREFGNAGRGLIVPLKLARTNEPSDYFIESSQQWAVARCVSSNIPFPVGLGGISIMTDQNFELRVGVEDTDNLDYSFDRIEIFHHPSFPSVNIEGATTMFRNTTTPFLTEVTFDSSRHSVKLTGTVGQSGDSSIVYGFSIKNSKPGVIYHAIGINGAQWNSYLKVENFSEQIKALNPDLIIFSLGTNEAFNDRLNKKVFSGSIDRLVSKLANNMPNTKIVISTPPECQRRYSKYNNKFHPNELIPTVRDVLVDYAQEKGYPYWDMFNITGGENSSQWWIENNYLAKDRIHFDVAGYKYQGELLYKAIINGYNDYVSNRY